MKPPSLKERTSGVLLHLTSLPGPHGSGDLGQEARAFADVLARAGQSWWQMLPVGPAGYGDSPYSALSAFAGNPLFIDLDALGIVIYPMRGQTTLLQAIALAGGQGSLADLNEVMVFRVEAGEKKILAFDVNKIRAGEAPDPVLVNDDLLVVKRSPKRVALRDSLLSDFFGLFNPFNYVPR